MSPLDDDIRRLDRLQEWLLEEGSKAFPGSERLGFDRQPGAIFVRPMAQARHTNYHRVTLRELIDSLPEVRKK